MTSFDMKYLPVDYIAFIGYLALLVFFAYKLLDTYTRPVDLIANLALVLGLGSYITYHYRKITESIDETNNDMQKTTRIVAHAMIAGFFLLTLTPYSEATYRFYDNFGLFGHVFLLWAVTTSNPQLAGYVLLALYFFFGSYRKVQIETGAETINLIGRVLLTIYFVTVSIAGIIDITNAKK